MTNVRAQKPNSNWHIAKFSFLNLPFPLWFLPFALCILYARHGYVFGSSDQSETLPYVLWLNNHNLYPSDFFLQSIIQKPFNERLFFVEFIRLFSGNLSYGVFILHVICTIGLVCGIYIYARNQFKSFSATWFAILFSFFFLYGINTGASELYDNTLNPSYITNVLIVWVFILVSIRRIFLATALLVVATLFQPLIGILIALIIFSSELLKLVDSYELLTLRFKPHLRTVLKAQGSKLIASFIFYASTAGIFIYSLLYQISTPTETKFIFQIIELRANHHYFPHSFSLLGYIFMIICVVAVYTYGSTNEKIWTFFIVAGCVVYAFGVYVLKSSLILNTQFFRITMWVKLWGTLLIMRQVLDYLSPRFRFVKYFLDDTIFKRSVFALGIFSALVIIPLARNYKSSYYMFPFLNYTDAVIEISRHAKKTTPNDALFITPTSFDAFRFYSERSNFIDFKATLHENAYYKTWYNRIQSVYGLSLDQKEKGFKLVPIANNNFNALSDSTLTQICGQNKIGYVIRDNAHPIHLGFTKIDSTAVYSIYKFQ